MIRFASPWALGLLLLIPFSIWGLGGRRRSASLAFPGVAIAAGLPVGWRAHAAALVPVLRMLALTGLIVALARPQHGVGRIKTSTDAVAIQLVVDRSGSMSEAMMFGGSQSTKIDVVKQVLGEFVLGDKHELKGRPNDLVGLTTFAGIAETVCPLVQDGKMVVELAKTIKLALQGPDAGTAIGDALALAAARLKDQDDRTQEKKNSKVGDEPIRIKSKVIVLLTDGRNNRGEKQPLEAAALAAEWGIKVYTIGIGGGEPVRMQGPGGLFGDLMRVDDFDEPTLQRIAQMTGGIYRRASDAEALRKVYAEIDSLEKTTVQTTQFTDYDERFTFPAAIGGAALLLEVLLAGTFLRRTP